MLLIRRVATAVLPALRHPCETLRRGVHLSVRTARRSTPTSSTRSMSAAAASAAGDGKREEGVGSSRFTGRTKSSHAQFISMADAKKASERTQLVVFVAATMNGWKLPILLEVLGVDYDVVFIDFDKSMQKSPEYLRINPNGRIPALYDREKDVVLAESGACLTYIAEKYGDGSPGSVLPARAAHPAQHWAIQQWVYWQVSGLGPAMGQAMYFQRIAAVKGHDAPFATARFIAESTRCLGVLDKQLQESGGPYLLGDAVTIADVACYPYARSYFWANLDVTPFPHLSKWMGRLDAHPAFVAGLTVPHERREFFGEGDVAAALAHNASQFKVAAGKPKGDGSD